MYASSWARPSWISAANAPALVVRRVRASPAPELGDLVQQAREHHPLRDDVEHVAGGDPVVVERREQEIVETRRCHQHRPAREPVEDGIAEPACHLDEADRGGEEQQRAAEATAEHHRVADDGVARIGPADRRGKGRHEQQRPRHDGRRDGHHRAGDPAPKSVVFGGRAATRQRTARSRRSCARSRGSRTRRCRWSGRARRSLAAAPRGVTRRRTTPRTYRSVRCRDRRCRIVKHHAEGTRRRGREGGDERRRTRERVRVGSAGSRTPTRSRSP